MFLFSSFKQSGFVLEGTGLTVWRSGDIFVKFNSVLYKKSSHSFLFFYSYIDSMDFLQLHSKTKDAVIKWS